MIFGIGSFLVKELHRLSGEVHELALETNPEDPRDLIPIVILDEEGQAVGVSKKRTLDSILLDVRGLRQLERLGRSKIASSGKIKIVLVGKNLECPGS